MHQGIHRTVSLIAVSEQINQLHKFIIVAMIALGLIVVAIGAALVLLRPDPTTWAFFFFCLLVSMSSTNVIFSQPFPMNYVVFEFIKLISIAGSVGLLIFAIRFLREPEGWRRLALRIMPLIFALGWFLDEWVSWQTYWFGGPPAELLSRVFIVVVWLINIVALYAFVDTYLRARGVDRQRIQWAVIGFGISLLASSALSFASFELTNAPTQLSEAGGLLRMLAPLVFGYAIIRHRVIDVSFVINRALVFGLLTSLLVGAFALIDWLFIDKLKLARLGTIAEMGAAIAGGFWFNGLHKRVDSFIDATFFRQRHRAEVQLARNAAALPSATTPHIAAQALVREPARALTLASAALFRRGKDGAYVREESEGWAAGDITRLDDNDGHFVMLLQAESGPISLYDHPWRTEGVPSGPAHPVLALPIIVRRELTAVVFYGAHVHGEALDPDEIKAIAGLAPGAAAAYDHLQAESMQRKVDSLENEVESLRIRLAEAQIQPA